MNQREDVKFKSKDIKYKTIREMNKKTAIQIN